MKKGTSFTACRWHAVRCNGPDRLWQPCRFRKQRFERDRRVRRLRVGGLAGRTCHDHLLQLQRLRRRRRDAAEDVRGIP